MGVIYHARFFIRRGKLPFAFLSHRPQNTGASKNVRATDEKLKICYYVDSAEKVKQQKNMD